MVCGRTGRYHNAMDSDPDNAGEPQAKAVPEFSISAIQAGDIVFIYDQSAGIQDVVKGFGNVIGQRVLAAARRTEPISIRSRLPYYSHVMLGLGGGLIIHADGRTVAVEILPAALQFQT